MAREKFQTLTEQMFYILLCLKKERCGMDVMSAVKEMTGGRIVIGLGTLYNLLDHFLSAGFITETRVEGKRRYYVLAEPGIRELENECQRIQSLISDFKRYAKGDIEIEEI